MRLYAIADTHGCLDELQALMAFVNPAPEDILVCLGDYIDRGPDSKGVLDWLVREGGRRNLVALRGNHEEMMLAARNSVDSLDLWLSCGGLVTLASYGVTADEDWSRVIPPEHWAFLEATVPLYEAAQVVLVHAGLAPDCELAEQPKISLYWNKFDKAAPHPSGKTYICGHTPQASGTINDKGFAVCINTGMPGGWLTCLEPASGCFWQVNHGGQTRTGSRQGLSQRSR